ncbi:MAG TPA: DUF1801 domain-containing protein [Anaerolineales bacterium]|nr:DUF1801 domain-containing protein [Anaerolineales bacterium]
MKMKRAAKSKNTVSPEDILSDHPAEIHASAEKLRKLIRESMPEGVESGHPFWHSINYRHPSAGYVCGLFPRNEYIDLVFEFGILLPDPQNVLQGDGVQVRYMRIRKSAEIPAKAIRQLISDALALPENRAIKMDLIRAKANVIR